MTGRKMNSAISELKYFLDRVSSDHLVEDQNLQYLAVLLSEFAYCEFTSKQLEKSQRVKGLIAELKSKKILGPSDSYGTYVFRQYGEIFVIRTEYFVAIGVYVKDVLYLAFRGTKIERLPDWRINLGAKAQIVNLECFENTSVYLGINFGVHSGFFAEAQKMCSLISEKIKPFKSLKRIILTGHSLGGAVASIGQLLFCNYETRLITFGAPKTIISCKLTGLYFNTRRHFVRSGDLVPELPPKFLGYYDLEPKRRPLDDKLHCSSFAYDLFGLLYWTKFAFSCFSPHSISLYRKEVGKRSGAKFHEEKFVFENEIPDLEKKFAF